MRLRILFGTLGLVFGLVIYALLVMRLAVAILPENGAAQLPFYVVTGTLWIFPAARLTRWMQDLPPPPDRFA
ncbi:MAG TPA: DUF2842 domain-containing protein [Aliidongia sp.]|nr:DUF2842 domain-containing protein [Aliidongia sp.]